MAAKDYQICPAIFNAYIAKVSKKQSNLMTDDRREISELEMQELADFYADKNAEEGERGIAFESYRREGYRLKMIYEKII